MTSESITITVTREYVGQFSRVEYVTIAAPQPDQAAGIFRDIFFTLQGKLDAREAEIERRRAAQQA